VVCFSACVAHLVEGVADLNIPYSTTLLSAIDAFLESEDMAFRDIESRRSFHVYFFLKVSIEISGLDVHLMYFKVVFGGESKDGVEGREFGNRGEGLVEIDAFNLGETLCNDVCFVLLYTAVGSVFDVENPFATYDLVTFWPRDDVINVQALPSLHLLFTGGEPLSSIRASHGNVVCLRLRSIGIGDIGMVFIGRDAVTWVIIQNWRASGVFRTRRSGRNEGRGGRSSRSSGRRWSVVGFKDNVLMV